MQLAAEAARQGHGRLAQELRGLVDDAKASPLADRGAVPLVQPRGELASVLAVAYPQTHLDEMILEPRVRARLDRVLREYRQQDKLAAKGLRPRRKILLLGPPGSGKTMTASALAGELQWPLFTIELDGLITKYMGETAAKLRLVFDSIGRSRGVYLFDEFDAIGVRRDSERDVGEIRRVLNSFLQFLERDSGQSLIVAATNHGELLDQALFRRFDDTVEYALPSAEQAKHLIHGKLAGIGTKKVGWKRVIQASRALSHAEITRACDDAVKEALLDDRTELSTADLMRALGERRGRL
jgi:SpoVK/Ycf46/Vps4 family AAA+-type ATPase